MRSIEILCSLFVVSILFIGCSTAKTVYKEQNSKGNSVKIVSDYFSGFLYFQLTESKKGNQLSKFTIEFADNGAGSISIKKSSYSNQGKYTYTVHAVSDTSGNPELLGKSYSRLLGTNRTGYSFEPVNSEDISTLKLMAREINKQNIQSKLTDDQISRILGWILIR